MSSASGRWDDGSSSGFFPNFLSLLVCMCEWTKKNFRRPFLANGKTYFHYENAQSRKLDLICF